MQASSGAFPPLSETARSALVRLLSNGPASRADLARHLNMSAPSLTRIVRSMEDAGLVVESANAVNQRTGRPAQAMDVDIHRAHLVGIKIARREIHLVRTDLRATVLSQQVIPVDTTDPSKIIEAMGVAIDAEHAADALISAVGISLAGPVSPHMDTVSISPFLGWESVPLVPMLRDRVGLPVVVENDVRALTAAEHWFGAATGLTDFALITVGVGIGCGLVINDRLADGTRGGGGQVGHLPITDSGPLCERGHRGCARSYLSSTLMLRQAREALGLSHLDWNELLRMASEANPVASRIVSDAGHALGTVIGNVAAITAPSKVLITGEGVGLFPLAEAEINSTARRIEHWTVPEVPIEAIPFTFVEWARGAAVIALQHLLTTSVRASD